MRKVPLKKKAAPVAPKTLEQAQAEAVEAVRQAAIAENPEPYVGPRVKTVIWYDFARPDGTHGSTRIIVEGWNGIRTQSVLLSLEKALLERSNGDLTAVLIKNWKVLED